MNKPTTPLLTVDIIIELIDRPEQPVILIKRRYPPYGWALPGGFVDVGETLEQAAVREAEEEISLQVELKCLLGCYSDPARDTRTHTTSAVYIAQASGQPVAADDARELELFPVVDLPDKLAFDHARILEDYRHFLKTGEVAELNSV
ncbi:ADP-ribose pyrophosphatase [hydrothermal vent metagenome]|uniref:ADP-ribose pyrophosphatase n=1 Tax=hydrothermal vent metagenome TaxID=652676 RepID=A0A3B1AIG3_9ZZZZ